MSAATRVEHRSTTDEWQTPPEVLGLVRQIGVIGYDPCTSPDNPVGAAEFSCKPPLSDGVGDGLEMTWALYGQGGLVYCNPPYSQSLPWARKISESAAHCEIVSLVKAAPDTRAFWCAGWDSADAICFWRGRIKFVGGEAGAPFPSAVLYHGPRPRRFEMAFADAGKVLRL